VTYKQFRFLPKSRTLKFVILVKSFSVQARLFLGRKWHCNYACTARLCDI